MKIDCTQKITDLDGTVIKQDDEKDVTLGWICARALNIPNPREPEKAFERGMLAIRIYNAETVELTPEEAAMIRKDLGVGGFPPVVVARASEMLKG